MKRKWVSMNRMLLGITFAALTVASGLAVGDETLRAGDPLSMDKWYGRAGGLIGSDRVMAIGKSSADRIGIKFDADVAKRTNMPRDGAAKGNVGITYDKDVAERTNMQRDLPPTQSAGKPATPQN